MILSITSAVYNKRRCQSTEPSVMRTYYRCNTQTSSPFWVLIVCLLCLAVRSETESHQCAVGITTPGRTWPAGDIVLEYGNPLRILCMLNKTYIDSSFPGKSSRDLVFFKGQRQIDHEFITVLNETTIQLDVNVPPPENAMYYCKLKLDENSKKDYEAVCLNKVVVGFKPQEPKNFYCMSQNWENMTCVWDPPHNYVDTTYSITFKLPGRAGGRKLYPCPSDTKPPEPDKEKPRNSCFWDSTTNPIYRQPYEYYTFYLIGENVLGHWNGSYKFHHFAHVIPARPTNLTVVNKTLDSALLHWSVSFPMQTFPPGLHHRVAHQNQWDSRETWQILNITDEPHLPKRYFNLIDLKYANTIYDIRVFIKSALAIGEDKWSNFSGVTFRTPPRIPGQAPRTDIGSFEIQENNLSRDIYLYWQSIPPYLENGDNFGYQVTYIEESGRRVFLSPNETTNTYARFRGLGNLNNYRFEIVSSNEVGILEEPARIFVPSRNLMPKEPVAFTKIAFDDGLYELSWKAPLGGDNDVSNYTIFWCENERDRPYQCQGYLEWLHIPKTRFVHNITVPDPRKVYQFAISANTVRASSGMVWASCTVIHNKVVGKMKTVWINHIDSTVIEVGWKLDCSDRIGIVEGFKIYYCPIVSPYNLNCKSPKLNTTIKADLNTIRGEVRGLKPYTTYMIAVAVLTKNGEGQHSDPLYNTTLESKPSDSPYDIMAYNVTNTTVELEWKKPYAMNGVLRYYTVYYDSFEKKVEEEPRVQLQGLRAYHNYTIRVAACTVECSEKSEPLYVLTDIGVPGAPLPPTVRFINSSRVRVLWTKPLLPAGMLDYYEVRSQSGELLNITNTEAIIQIPDCKTDGKEKMYRFYVRAVNIALNRTHLYGNWSDAGEGNCFNGGPSYSVWLLIWSIGSICGIAFVFCIAYSSKRIWLKCRAMRDVEVKLPSGLAPNIKLLQKGDQHTRQSSADSSGCSSAQESVTSSLTGSQPSNDSGAEVDTVRKKSVVVAADSSATANSSPDAWESSSIRQRNSLSASKPANLEAIKRTDSYANVKGSNELAPAPGQPADSSTLARSTPNLSDQVGLTNPQQPWSSAGYLSTSSVEDVSNNLSQVPMNTGGYCIVNILPMLSKTRTNESEMTTKTNPFVSVKPLEENTKDGAGKALDSLPVFQNFDLSKQLYQTSHFNSKLKPPTATTTLEQQPNVIAQTSLANELTSKLVVPKPYIRVASFSEATTRVPEIPLPSTSTTATKNSYAVVGQLPPSSPMSSEMPPQKSLPSSMPSTTTTTTTTLAATAATAATTTTTTLAATAATTTTTMAATTATVATTATTTTPTTPTELKNNKRSETKQSVIDSIAEKLQQPKTPSAVEDFSDKSTSKDKSQEKISLHPSVERKVKKEPSTTSSTNPTISVSFTEPKQMQKLSSGYVTLPEQQHGPATHFAKPKQKPTQQLSDDKSYSKVAVMPHTTK